jgi:hypothetical protein
MLSGVSESFEGVGDTPGLAVGSNVIGFYMDGEEAQMPVVLGSYPTMPSEEKSGISYLARGKQTINKEQIGPEPPSSFAAKYPYNRVITTKSGHVIELDDTPENERIHVFHRSGTYIEVNPDGRIVIKTPDESYDITGKSKTIYSGEDINIIAERGIKLATKGNVTLGAKGGLILTEGSLFTKGAIGTKVGATGSFSSPTGQRISVVNGIVTSIDPAG